LIFVYPQWDVRQDSFAWWLPLLGTIAVTAALWSQRRRPWGRALLFAWSYYCVTLLPVLGFADVGFMKYSLVADHYQYLALVAVTGVVAAAIVSWSAWVASTQQWIGWVVGLALAGILAFLAHQQSATYRDPITLYQATVDRNPNSAMAHYNLGQLQLAAGQTSSAMQHFEQALAIDPQYSAAENNLGTALVATGRVPEGVARIQHALQMDPKNVVAYNNLGKVLLDANQPQEALREFERAVGINPQNTDALYGGGTALLKLEQPEAAIERFERAVRARPDFGEAHYNLGLALVRTGRLQDAIGAFDRAVQIKFREADANIEAGTVLVKLGKTDDAVGRFQLALKLKPDHPAAFANLAAIAAGRNQPAEAAELGRKALNFARQQGNAPLAEQIESWMNSLPARTLERTPAVPAPTLPPAP
jgi:tetratricopeptide (TPR) repeat protein